MLLLERNLYVHPLADLLERKLQDVLFKIECKKKDQHGNVCTCTRSSICWERTAAGCERHNHSGPGRLVGELSHHSLAVRDGLRQSVCDGGQCTFAYLWFATYMCDSLALISCIRAPFCTGVFENAQMLKAWKAFFACQSSFASQMEQHLQRWSDATLRSFLWPRAESWR